MKRVRRVSSGRCSTMEASPLKLSRCQQRLTRAVKARAVEPGRNNVIMTWRGRRGMVSGLKRRLDGQAERLDA